MKSNGWKVNPNVIFLGIVSFLTDVSSEMIFAVFSVFFTVVLGASSVLLGVIEGLADFSASSLDYISGFISDKFGKRKIFAIIGYGFSTLAKTILIISSTITSAFAFRVVERLGKSFRGPPRDAWLSKFTTDKNRGYYFGIHKTLDKLGAILGPFIAYWILSAYGQNLPSFKLLFKVALVPAILAVLLLMLLKEKGEKTKIPKRENIFTAYKRMGSEFKSYILAGGIFSLAYFSFGFLLLKAYLVGFQIKDVVLLYALFNVSFVLVAAPIGKMGDLIGRKKIIILGYAAYLLLCLGFIFAATKLHIVLLFLLFGIFYAIDESQSKAYITSLEKDRRASALGFYSFITGLIYLPASIIAGILWKQNPDYAFAFAGIMTLFAMIFFISKNGKK